MPEGHMLTCLIDRYLAFPFVGLLPASSYLMELRVHDYSPLIYPETHQQKLAK